MAATQKEVNEAYSRFLSTKGAQKKVRIARKTGKGATPEEAAERGLSAEDTAFLSRRENDPGEVRRLLDMAGDPGGEIDWRIIRDDLKHRQLVADAVERGYKLTGKDADRVLAQRKATREVLDLLDKGERVVGIQKELASIAKRGIGREAVVGGGAVGYMAAGPVGLAVGALAPAILDPSKLIKTRAILDRLGGFMSAQSKVQATIKRGVDQFFKAGKTGRRSVRAGTVPAAVLSFLPRKGKDDRDLQGAFRRVREDLETTARDPQILQDRLGRRLATINHSNPEIATHVAIAAARAADYLLTVAPTPAASPSPIQVASGAEPEIPDTEIKKWFRQFEVAEKGAEPVVRDMVAGTATPEQFKALKAVYPRQAQALAQEIMERVKSGAPVSYDNRIQLSFLLGIPLDNSLTGDSIAFYQSTIAKDQSAQVAQATGQGGGGKKPKPKKTKIRAKAQDRAIAAAQTPAQRIAQEA